jgi:ubiquinone/menaquinone biosynthesis C-methylase UbiE
MSIPWLYDETVQTGTNYRDEAEVRAYDERMGKLRDVVPEAEEIRGAIAATSGSTVWEIGTGTGECALHLARSCKKVIATDVSPAMLAYARRKAADRNIANVVFERGGFLSGYAPEDPVDAVVSQLALHHLPDFWKARGLSLIAVKLRPGGKFFLRDVVYPPEAAVTDVYFRTAIDASREKAGETGAKMTIEHIKKEYSTLDWVLEGMLERAGLLILRKEVSGFLTSYLCER